MKFERGILCRDNGTIFLQVFLEGDEDRCRNGEEDCYTLNVSDKNGNSLPGRLYHRLGNEYVIAVPQLNVDIHVEITCKKECDKANSASLAKFLIAGNWAKWESRLNYRVNKKAASKIKNIHRKFYDVVPEVAIASVSSGVHECVIRGSVIVPSLDIDEIELSLIDVNGKPIGEPTLLKQHSPINLFDGEQPFFSVFPYSIKAPRKGMFLCFIAKFPHNHTLDTFLTLPRNEYIKRIFDYQETATCASCDEHYGEWFDFTKASPIILDRQRSAHFDYEPTFSIIVPLYHTPLKLFNEMASSVVEQSYSHWQLVLVNSTPEDEELRRAVLQLEESDSRVKVVELAENLGISGNTNKGIEAATGDYVAFFDHDDLLEPDILFEYAYAINKDPSIDLLYCDEDKVDDNGNHMMPFFKPDFSIDHLRNNNYICHMLTMKKSLLDKIGPFPEGYEGAQDHYMTFRATEETSHIYHVPRILYHWRATSGSTALDANSKTYASESGLKAVQGNLDRLGIDAVAEPYGRPFAYRVRYNMPKNTKISIVIPSHNEVDALRNCIDSIVKLTEYTNYEIVLVENNSTQKELFDYYDELTSGELPVKVVTWEGVGFNFSSLVNFGVENSDGDVVVLLNNDTEVTNGNWLDVLGGLACRKDVGAAGPTLFYPDGTYQHAGLSVTGNGVSQLFWSASPDALFAMYMNFQDMTRNVLAVTGACMAVRRSVFDEVGGFDEEFAVAFNDVDFCLRLIDAGYLNVYTADTSLVHIESLTRNNDIAISFKDKVSKRAARREDFMREKALLQSKWVKYYIEGDPYYNPNLNQLEPYSRFFSIHE